jgi:drug/metabolite transporter (DMT)-like permease
MVKASPDPHLDMARMGGAVAVVAAASLPFVPPPAAGSWPFLAASAAIHLAYFSLVAAAYRAGELSLVYPVMRGTAPLLTAAAGAFVLGEPLGIAGAAGILLISAGILLLAAGGWRRGRGAVRATLVALLNAAVIALYTIVDGIGTRRSGSPLGYVGWLLLASGLLLVARSRLRGGAAPRFLAGSGWPRAIAGGACTWASYAIALWAMTRAPVAMVAALRETSVIFGTALAWLLLGERFGAPRWAAALLVFAGAAAIRS